MQSSRYYSAKRAALPVLGALAPLLKGHVPLDRALVLLVQKTPPGRGRAVVQALADSLRQGASMSQAFAQHEAFFGSAAVAAARAGERSGQMAETLGKHADYMGRQLALRRRLALALIYPSIVLLMALLGSMLILLFFVPRMKGLLDSIGPGQDLPWPTRALLGVSSALQSPLGLAGLAAILVAILALVVSPRLRLALAPVTMRLPLVGPLLKTGALARAFTSLASLLHAAVSLPEALLLAGAASGNPVVGDAFAAMTDAVERGQPLSQAMRLQRQALPSDAAELTLVGEETGALPEQLDLLAKDLEEQAARRGQALLSLLEPVLIIAMGLLVGLVVAAVFLPLVSLLNGLSS